MISTPQARIFVALVVLSLAMGEARAQISVLERPVSGGVSVVQTLPYSTFTRSYPCLAPGFKATFTLDPTNFPSEYGGALEAGDASISGAINKKETWQFNSSVDAQSSYNMNIFADVVPGSKVRLRFYASYQISWSDGNVLENHAGFLFTPESGAAINGGVVKGGNGLPSASEQFSVDLQASPTYSTTEGGRTYYKLGNFSITGRGVLGRTNSGESVSYRAGISNIQAYYIGPALMLNDGSAQTGLVGKGLPKSLSVKVSDGETGAVVPGVQITFTIAEPSNGAKFSNGLTTIVADTVEGIASASLILGSTAGPYTVKATCPAETCTSGMKEVAFSATAIMEENALELRKLSGDGAMTVGRPTLNQLRVQAFNTLTGVGKPDVDVGFSILSAPVGGEDASLGVSGTLTDAYGVAKTSFTLGAAEGDYVVKAVCESCQANREVQFAITGRAPVQAIHPTEEGKRTTVPQVTLPGETGFLQIAFQNDYMKRTSGYRIIPEGELRIGALAGDTISFKAITAPDKELAKSAEWIGHGKGEASVVLYNNAGEYRETVTVAGKSKTISVVVVPIPNSPNWTQWFSENPPHIGGTVLWCGIKASLWVESNAWQYSVTAHNSILDAERHAYWNACVTNILSAPIAEGVGNARERTTYEAEYPPSRPRNIEEFWHNEIVMDLENNAVGRRIGGELPPLVALSAIHLAVAGAAANGELVVLDDTSNANRAGLLKASK